MTEDDHYTVNSPLAQSVTRDGKTVQIEIYEDGEGGWFLEVVDEHGNTTIWDDPFPSDQDALNEALRTIAEEGIESLIGIHPESPALPLPPNPLQMMVHLFEEDMNELIDFLVSDAISEETMTPDCLDGFLTAIASGPVMVKPSEWLPRVWGPTVNDEPTFDTFAQAERITSLIIRQMNDIILSLQQDPDAFKPIFQPAFDFFVYPDSPREYTNGRFWANGYMSGIDLQRQNWRAFFDEPTSTEVLRPIYLLGSHEVTLEEMELRDTPEQIEELSNQIPASVSWIYRFWQPYRTAMEERSIADSFQLEHPMVGRNDPCPCGSGKKFKNCCGASTLLH